MKLKFILTFFMTSLFLASSFAAEKGPANPVSPGPGELLPTTIGIQPVIGAGASVAASATASTTAATMQLIGGEVAYIEKSIQTSRPTSVQNRCSNTLMTCGIALPGNNENATKFFETLNNAFGNERINREDYCDCLRANVPHTSEAMTSLKKQIKENLRSDVQDKLVRDFSLQLEDLHFYWMLDSFKSKVRKMKEESETELNIRCHKEDAYKKAFDLNPKCQALNLDNKAKERKLAEIFGSVTDISSGKLQATLSGVEDDVLMTDLKDSDCSSPEKYSRVCYDRDRIGLNRSEIGQVPDRFLRKVLKSPSLSRNIILISKEEHHSPMEALHEMLVAMISSQSQDILDLVESGIIDNSLYQKLTQGIQNGNLSPDDQKDIINALMQVVASGAQNHPGISNLLDDVNKFEEVAGSLDDSSLVTFLEKDTDKIINDYLNKCEALVTSFAEVACSSDDELLNGMNEHDLEEYALSLGIQDDQTKNLTTVLACENTETYPFMKHLVPGKGLSKISDFFARENGHSGSFDRLRIERFKTGSPVGQTIANAVTRYGASSSDFFDFDFFDDGIGESNVSKLASRSESLIAPTNADKSKGKALSELFSNLSQKEPDQKQVSMDPGFYSNAISNPVAQSGTINSKKSESSESTFDARRELREYLRGKVEEEELDELMSNTDDGLMQELMELKAEMELNKKKLLELSAENERLKLDSLKKRMDRLQNERAVLAPQEPIRERQMNNVVRRDSPLNPPSISRNIPAATPAETGGSSAGTASTFSGQSSSEGASLGGLNRALLSSGSSSSRSPASDSSVSNPVVVSASTTRSGSIEIESQEVGLDLLNYLSNNGSSIQTLIKLKTSGIIYKYKVLENGDFVEKEVLIEYSNLNEDVKKIIDKKIAQSENKDREILRLDNEIKELQRIYSYSALRLMIAEQMRK